MSKLSNYIDIGKTGIEQNRTPDKYFNYFSIPDFDTNKSPSITLGSEIDSNKFLINSETLLISKLNPRKRRVWKVMIHNNFDSISSTEFVNIIMKPKSVLDFFYYKLQSNEIFSYLESIAIGSTNSHVRFRPEKIYEIDVNIPSPAHQRKIARILSTIDNVIETTEAAIAKYKAIKQGMMHDLFTRGIDKKTGKLRPTKEEAPYLYKETELGWIPKEWKVERLEDVGAFQNGINKDKESFGQGTAFVNIIDAYPEKLDISKLGKVLTTKSEDNIYKLEKGDIIFVRSSVKPEGVAYTTIFTESKETAVYCGFMIRFRIFNKSELIPNLYNHYFRFGDFRKRVIALSTVSANTNINQESLKSLNVIKIESSEQFEILKKIDSIISKIETEQKQLSKLQKLKQGVMQDLLTGKKEVEPDEEVYE